jgi:hypothetical protein
MKQIPEVWTPTVIKSFPIYQEHKDGIHAVGLKEQLGATAIPYRPNSPYKRSWMHRLKLAWSVFIGRYDALDWSYAGSQRHDTRDLNEMLKLATKKAVE